MLFIIGNGFDMALGLDTSYSAFLDLYTSQSSEDDTPTIIKLGGTVYKQISCV